VYIHLSIISRSTCGSIRASALAGYQRYTGWSYLTSPLYRQYNFRNHPPLRASLPMLVQRTQRAFATMAYGLYHSRDKPHVSLAPIHCRYCKQKPLKARPLPSEGLQPSKDVSVSTPISTPSSICRRIMSRPQHSTFPPGASLIVTESRTTLRDQCQEVSTSVLPFR
jgi:hypothetical protein